MSLEKRIAAIARTIFLPEFSFAANRFQVEKVGQLELADHVVWADDLLIAIQMKEREPDLPEANWFEDKVLKKATKQVRDTLSFLDKYDSIVIENQRGHRFHLEPAKLKRKFMVVVYDEPSVIYRARPNHYVSKTAGLIHVLRSTDLLDVCRTLITLSEIASYLEFRANIVRLNSLLSERAILGQFLRGASNELPDERNVEEFSRFRRNRSRFDLRWFFEELPTVIHTNHNGDDKSYYGILKEYVLLDRFELEQARIRIGMVNKNLQQRRSDLRPVVMATQRGTCFVWIAVPDGYVAKRLILLQNMLMLAKYVTRSDRCVGMAYSIRPDGLIELDMAYVDDPWAHDPLAEQHLAEHNPFQPFGIEDKPGYRID